MWGMCPNYMFNPINVSRKTQYIKDRSKSNISIENNHTSEIKYIYVA